MSKGDGKCVGYACCGMVAFALFLGSLITWLQYAENFEINEVSCFVSDVKMPHSLPNETYDDMWASCDCGKNCWAKTPVVNIYVDIDGEEDNIRTIYSNKKKDKGYTIYDYKCPDGENIVKTINRFDEIKKYQVYLNTTQTCYKNKKGNVFLYFHEQDILVPVMLSCILGLSLLCILGIWCLDTDPKPSGDVYYA